VLVLALVLVLLVPSAALQKLLRAFLQPSLRAVLQPLLFMR
jgi:hypothetical protein